MRFLAGLAMGWIMAVGVAVGVSSGAVAPAMMTATTTTSTTVAATTTTVVADGDARCPQWWNVAVSSGWEQDDLRDLDEVLWRESRCDPSQVNTDDPNIVDGVKGSVGLTQVNVFWVQGTKWYPNGYLQTVSVVSGVQDLFDPFLNLRAAKAIFDYDRGEGRCGWSAWAWKGCD
jgi:hypothetical protein